MLSGFIAGAAGTASDLLSKEALEDARSNADLLKAQRIMEMNADQNEKLRLAGADRFSGYFAPTTTNVPGAATAVDDDGNSTAPNDYTKSTPASLELAAQRAATAGDASSMAGIYGMKRSDENTEGARIKADNILTTAKLKADAMISIADQKDGTKREMYLDEYGNPIQRGKPSDLTITAMRVEQHEADDKSKKATVFELELGRERKVYRDIQKDLIMSSAEKKIQLESQNELIKEITTRRDEANKLSNDAKDRMQAILTKSINASNAAGKDRASDNLTPTAGGTMAKYGAPADLTAKYNTARAAAATLGSKSPPPTSVVTPVNMRVQPSPVAPMLAPTEDEPDYPFSGGL